MFGIYHRMRFSYQAISERNKEGTDSSSVSSLSFFPLLCKAECGVLSLRVWRCNANSSYIVIGP